MQQPRPFSGFNLQTACRLDAAYPGYLNHVLHAHALKRSAHFAAYPEIDFSQPEILATRLRALMPSVCEASVDPVAQIVRALMLLPPRTILSGLYGSVPDGLLGLLSRLGFEPLSDRSDYRLAFSLFADPMHKARAKLLRQIEGQIASAKIQIAARLDPALLHRSVLDRLYDVEQVEVLHAALTLIRAAVPGVNDEVLRRSLHGLSPSDHDLSEWIARWLRRMERVPITPPIPPGDAELRLLHGADMVELGRRFRNCAADRIASVALAAGFITNGSAWTAQPWLNCAASAVVALSSRTSGVFAIWFRIRWSPMRFVLGSLPRECSATAARVTTPQLRR